MSNRFQVEDLTTFSYELLTRAGLEAEKARVASSILVEGDLLGHTTHGLSLLPAYLNDLKAGTLAKAGNYSVVADFPAALTLDGMRQSGPWLTQLGLNEALSRAKQLGTGTVVIKRSHHIACLASYLRQIAEQGYFVTLACSDPTAALVAPHGGKVGVYTPNPIASAWPTRDGIVIFDVSLSILAFNVLRRASAAKKKIPGKWILDSEGNPTDEPDLALGKPAGSLLPLGGLDHGHKGYALGLWVETLTSALAGHGRLDPHEGWTASVFIQVCDPKLFGGEDAFIKQTTYIAEACRATPPRAGFDQVRMPGDMALKKRERQLKEGVELYETILPNLAPYAELYHVDMPKIKKA
jgi:L-lactate dehydrogenase